MQEETTVQNITKTYKSAYDLTDQKFADEITKSLKNTNISRVSVTNWSNGKSSPSTDFLLLCAVVYDNWIRAWAMGCLKAKLPEVFDSGIIEFKLPIIL